MATATTGSLFFPIALLATVPSELVGAYGYGWTTAADPPDLINFALRANEPLLIPTFPPAPGASPEFNQAVNDYIASVSGFVQSRKNILVTSDRLAGAKLVGTPTDVANQELWLSEFSREALQRYRASQAVLQRFNARLAVEFSDIHNFVPSLTDVIAVKNQEAAGQFSDLAESFMDSWRLTPLQRQLAANSFASIPDEEILHRGPVTVGAALAILATLVPVPATAVTGSASRLGIPPALRQDTGAQVRLSGKFIVAGELNLTNAAVYLRNLLTEVGADGELLKGIRGADLGTLTLTARSGRRPNAAILETPSRVRPRVRMEIKNRDTNKRVFEFALKVERGAIPTFPQLCGGASHLTTNLLSNFTIDDGVNAHPPVVVATVQAWRCLDLIGDDPKKPRSLRVP
jgi:hypothetical protein